MPSSKDPRSYVRRVPVPVPDHRGKKIQARVLGTTPAPHPNVVYNAEIESREQVFRSNYKRRFAQQQEQGFQSVAHKPYKGIGDPFYLDPKRLILHALGQWQEGQELDTSSSSDSEEDSPNPNSATQSQRTITAAKFVLRRTRKDLNTLNSERTHHRRRLRNVRLGHSLFQQIRQERDAKLRAEDQAERRKREAEKREWQPPRSESSSDGEGEGPGGGDTDDELAEDEDLRNYMISSSGMLGTDDGQQKPGVTVEPSVGGGSGGVGVSLRVPSTLSRVPSDGSSVRRTSTAKHSTTPQATLLALPDQTRSKVNFQGSDGGSLRLSEKPKSGRSRQGSSRGGSRKKQVANSRPFTPQHTNIAADSYTWADRYSLFRQLCALHWLLEAMNLDSNQAMTPIITSWDLHGDIGGSKILAAKSRQSIEKQNDTKWKNFLTNPSNKVSTSRRFYHGRLSVRQTPRRLSTQPRGSIASNSNSPQGSHQNLNSVEAPAGSVKSGVAGGVTAGGAGSTILEGEEEEEDRRSQLTGTGTGTADGEDEPLANSKATSDDIYDQFSRANKTPIFEEPQQQSQQQNEQGSTPDPRRSVTPQPQPARRQSAPVNSNKLQTDPGPRMPSVTFEEFTKTLDAIQRGEDDPRMHALANPTDRLSSKKLRADLIVRPMSTPAVVDYQSKLPSNKAGLMTSDMRQKFREVSEEKALLLHEALEAKERTRMRLLQNKFLNLPPGGCSFHRAVGAMRHKTAKEEENREKRRKSLTTHLPWFSELESNIPEDILQDWYFENILEKLSKYGQVDSGKQSAFKFLRVLEALRDWEVCSPDISAAVEFCREKIVEMSVDEYEEWFQQQFPTVIRPHTAPARVRSGNKDKAKRNPSAPSGGEESSTVPLITTSAPPRIQTLSAM